MGQVQQILVVGVGVHCRHETRHHAEGIIEDLDHRDEAVRRARGIRHHVVGRCVILIVVDADYEGCVGASCGS